MRKNNTEKLSQILKSYIEQNNLQPKLSELDVLNSWEAVMGKTVASYTEDIQIRNGTLFLRISSPMLRNELVMMREQIIQRLNENAGAELVQQIVFR